MGGHGRTYRLSRNAMKMAPTPDAPSEWNERHCTFTKCILSPAILASLDPLVASGCLRSALR
jgi:hypothetical protein